MLERQQGQLVACIQQLYQRLRTAGLWEQPLPENSGGKPFTHDILAALDLLGAKDDGSGELESFHNVARSPQSDDDITLSLFDGDIDIRDHHHIATSPQPDDGITPPGIDGGADTRDRHDSMMEQSKSPTPISKYTTSPMAGLAGLENHSKASTRPLSSPDASLELSSESPRQSTSSQSHIEHFALQTWPLANLDAAPFHGSAHNSPSTFYRNTGTTPSLYLHTSATRQNYFSSDRIPAGTSMHFPFWHAWARSGIMIDISDFSTDFHMLSPLNPSRYHSHFHGML
jgi:hypothetical protein